MRDIRIDYEKETITMTKKFAVSAENPYTSEHRTLEGILKLHPTFKVQRHTIKKNPNKEGYKGLTYGFMKSYISTHDPEPELALAEFDELLYLSKCHSIKYPTIKKWFLKRYKEVKQYGKDNAEIVEMVNNVLDFESLA